MNRNDIIQIFGFKGFGKTTLVKEIVKKYSRVIVLDKLCEYGDSGVVVYDSLTLSDYLIRHNAENLGVKFRLICQFHSDYDIDALFAVVWSLGNTLVVIEEIDFYADAVSIHPRIYELINYGRHREISIIGCARRPHSVSRDLTALSDVIVTFFQDEPRDLDYLGEFFSSEKTLEIPNLEKYRYLYVGEANNQNINLILDKGVTSP